MALAATTIWENNTSGVDGNTGNGGGFDAGNASMATDLAATVATSTAPVVTSASYNFIARDVGAWLFVKSGTNWTPGWYKIASTSSNAATLTATAGTGVLLSTYAPTTADGCATTASPTSGTWSIDYSQSTGAGITYTDMVIAVTTTNYTSVANPVGPNVVGNIIAISSGVNFTVQRVQVNSVSGTTATCDKSLGTAAAVAGNGILGGALLSPGQAGALAVSGNWLFMKTGTYSITSATQNIASGCISWPLGSATAQPSSITGYNAVRGDISALSGNSSRPLLQAGNAISAFTILTTAANTRIQHLSLDGANLTTSKGCNIAGNTMIYNCKVVNCKNNAISGTSTSEACYCEATGCSTQACYDTIGCSFCTAHDNTVGGFNTTTAYIVNCISCNNTTGTAFGFTVSNTCCLYGCLAYGNAGQGFSFSAAASRLTLATNCLAVNNGLFGFTDTAVEGLATLINCAGFNNSSGNVKIASILPYNTYGFITLTADPFTNAAGNDFSLNNTAGGGVLLKQLGFPASFPGLSTNNYPDVGPVDHQNTSSSTAILSRVFSGV